MQHILRVSWFFLLSWLGSTCIIVWTASLNNTITEVCLILRDEEEQGTLVHPSNTIHIFSSHIHLTSSSPLLIVLFWWYVPYHILHYNALWNTMITIIICLYCCCLRELDFTCEFLVIVPFPFLSIIVMPFPSRTWFEILCVRSVRFSFLRFITWWTEFWNYSINPN